MRPKPAQVHLLAHLSYDEVPKLFGSYSALAVMAFLLRQISPNGDWASRVADHLYGFLASSLLDVTSMGVVPGWLDEELWRS